MTNISKKQIPPAYIIIGRSGCGKGTQIQLLRDYLEKVNPGTTILKVESGALLREFSKGDNFTQKKIKEIIENGILVPEAEIIALWVNHLANNFTGKELLMFDGCPRKLKEAQQLSEILDFYDISEIVLIQINVSRQWATDRMLARGRKDDSVGGISHRMEYFDKEVVPVIEYFKGLKNCKFVDVNGEQPIEEVQNELLAKLGLNL